VKINCSVDEKTLDGDYCEVDGICVTCKRCGYSVEVFGTSGASERRGLVQCPKGESNFYVTA
jgi:hypothetical protein